MSDRRSILRAVFVVALIATSTAVAHPISVTQADALVTSEKLTIAVELFLEDLFLFHGLQPDKDNYLAAADIRVAMEKHKAFLLERLDIRDVQGERLVGKVVKIDECELPEKGIPITDLMAHSLVYHIDYPLPGLPEYLTFNQMLGNTSFGFPAQMLLRLKLENSEVPYMAELRSNEPLTMHLDPKNPPPPPDATQKQWEEWEAKRNEQSLGITRYSQVYSFLYIEDFEVRHEILVPLLSIEASQTIPRKDPAFLDVQEQDAVRPAIAAMFQKANPVKIDGIAVVPSVERIDFYGLDFKDFAQRADKKRVSMASARVGVILAYSTKGTPSTVELTWDLFNKFLWGAETVIFAFDKTHRTLFSPYQKSYTWKNPGRPAPPTIENVSKLLPSQPRWTVPAVSLGFVLAGVLGAMLLHRSFLRLAICLLAGTILAAATLQVGRVEIRNPFASAPSLDNSQARSVLESLQKNIYRSFDNKDERSVYDALAKSIAGPLLEKTYLDIRKGLVMQEQGGAAAKVTNVKLVDAKRESRDATVGDPRGFRMRAIWNVTGTVEHWGHIHERTNEYQATFTIEPRHDAWKIVALDVTSESPKGFVTRLRNTDPADETAAAAADTNAAKPGVQPTSEPAKKP